MITKEQAVNLRHGQEIYFQDTRGRISRCRVTGQCKTWKTRPADFSVPVKYGMYENGHCFYFERRELINTGPEHRCGGASDFFLTVGEARAAYPDAPVQKGL